MSATNHTQNYDLSQFVGGDIPSWLNDYNGDMSKIDTAIASVAQGSGDVAADVASLKSRMTSAEADIDAAESNISTLQSTTSTQGAAITQNANNITTTNNNVSALDTRVTALENAGGSGLDFGSATVLTITPSTDATLDSSVSAVSYATSNEGKFAKIYGGIKVTLANPTTEIDHKIASLNTAFTGIATAFDMMIGFAICQYAYSSENYTSAKLAKLHVNTDGTIDVYVDTTGMSGISSIDVAVSLPACIYEIIDLGD